MQREAPPGYAILDDAIEAVLRHASGTTADLVLWKLQYEQCMTDAEVAVSGADHTVTFPWPSLDLALDDDVLAQVKSVWEALTDCDDRGDGFLVFPHRETMDDDIAGYDQ